MKFYFQYGDIYLVNFDPSIGHEFQKERPAIIIQSNETIKRTNLITVMGLTSNVRGKQTDDILLKKDYENSLFCDSIAKVQAIHAFDKSRFKKKIGLAAHEIMVTVGEYLKRHFNLRDQK